MAEPPRIAEKDPIDVARGAFPAWRLPSGPAAAGAARAVVRTVLGGFRMARGAGGDAELIISELASNAVLYGERAEVWAYVRGRERAEVVFKVFDAAPWRGAADDVGRLPSDEEVGGRGLVLVHALVGELGGRWGVHATRSRLGTRVVSGKAVFFSVPLPEGVALGGGWSSRERVCALAAARGLHPRVFSAHGMAVVHLAAGQCVWVGDDGLRYDAPGRVAVRYPAGDVVEVVEQVVRHCEELAFTGPSWDFG